jgi:hypothetical protein
MIEIFRTNIVEAKDANRILIKIHSAFPGYVANFDLTDCDHILRVYSGETLICPSTIVTLVKRIGFFAEVLPDVLPDQRYSDSYQTSESI